MYYGATRNSNSIYCYFSLKSLWLECIQDILHPEWNKCIWDLPSIYCLVFLELILDICFNQSRIYLHFIVRSSRIYPAAMLIFSEFLPALFCILPAICLTCTIVHAEFIFNLSWVYISSIYNLCFKMFLRPILINFKHTPTLTGIAKLINCLALLERETLRFDVFLWSIMALIWWNVHLKSLPNECSRCYIIHI